MKNSNFYDLDYCSITIYGYLSKIKVLYDNKNEETLSEDISKIIKDIPLTVNGMIMLLFDKIDFKKDLISVDEIKNILMNELDKYTDYLLLTISANKVYNEFLDTINSLKSNIIKKDETDNFK